jgi:hypothetical protein
MVPFSPTNPPHAPATDAVMINTALKKLPRHDRKHQLDLIGAYYRYDQNAYAVGANAGCEQASVSAQS